MAISENTKSVIFMVNFCLWTKLNNAEAELTGVPPQCFVIVIVKQAMGMV